MMTAAAGGNSLASPAPPSGSASRPPAPSGAEVLGIPPLAPKPVLPVKSKLNPLAKEWKPASSATSSSVADAKPPMVPAQAPLPQAGTGNPPGAPVDSSMSTTWQRSVMGQMAPPVMAGAGVAVPTPYGSMPPTGPPYGAPFPVASSSQSNIGGPPILPGPRGGPHQEGPGPAWVPPRSSLPGGQPPGEMHFVNFPSWLRW